MAGGNRTEDDAEGQARRLGETEDDAKGEKLHGFVKPDESEDDAEGQARRP